MKLFIFVPLLLASATAKLNSEDDLVITKDFFSDTEVKYTSKHDIVNIVVPLNNINFGDDAGDDTTVFFVEADVNDKGERVDQGLYKRKKDKVTNILANGRDATAFNDDTKQVYLGASDGIYVYDDSNGTTRKYGSLTDNIIQIEADNQTGIIYFVTGDHEVFSVADEGTKKNKVENIKDVEEIVFDYIGNLYYYDTKKDIYVFNQAGVKKIEGIPKQNYVKLIRPMIVQEEGVYFIVDSTLYSLNANGSFERKGVTFEVKPTAYALEASVIRYYAWNKKLYETNVMEMDSDSNELKNSLKKKTKQIKT